MSKHTMQTRSKNAEEAHCALAAHSSAAPSTQQKLMTAASAQAPAPGVALATAPAVAPARKMLKISDWSLNSCDGSSEED